jgi:hypothetical protein
MHPFSKKWQPGVSSENDVTVDDFFKRSTFLGI